MKGKERGTNHFLESSYFIVAGTDTQAESTFLKVPALTLHSICIQAISTPFKLHQYK
jgi:hypothetical protein